MAEHYGIEGIRGDEFAKVDLQDQRRGVLMHASVLLLTSNPTRTSPVKRGKWVLENLLAEAPPPPPPDVPVLSETGETLGTLRQRMEQHRANPNCAVCHVKMDAVGFGLENFDAIGRWRDQDDSGGAIDAAGELPGGQRFASPKELKAIIAARADVLARNLTEKLLAYALCRQLEGYDEIVVDHLMETIAEDGYRMQTLITEIVTSYPFTHRRIQEPVELSANEN
jgi:hypothetical protein